MAVNQGEGTLCFVLLLCCWQETELRPRIATPGRAPQGWLSRKRTEPSSTTEIPFSSKHEDVPELLDEILVQEILDMNKTTWTEMPSTASTLSTIRKENHAGIDENYQAGGSENYHELLENLQFSSATEDKVSSDEASANANLHSDPSENYSGPQVSPGSEKTVSSKEKTNSKNTQYENLSFLDKILQNIGRSSGNIFRNEQQRTSSQRKSRDSQ
uniref:sperm acrosome-associated protein 7 isoform X3 n=1 Tax=Macaca mulatta TaxID=9544 RepID=UPI0010A22965|nr:sperm acrosome-associated protein 7 isoform X3 [Macaca mulatta]